MQVHQQPQLTQAENDNAARFLGGVNGSAARALQPKDDPYGLITTD